MEARTAASLIATTCIKQLDPAQGAQLIAVSAGTYMDEVVAELMQCQQHVRRAAGASAGVDALHLVVVPDGQQPGTTERIAASLQRCLARTSSSNVDETANVKPLLRVRAVEEGCSPRERCLRYADGGVVVLASRILCTDILHRRLSVAVIAITIVLLTMGGGTSSSTSSSPSSLLMARAEATSASLAFSVELLLHSGRGTTPPPLVLLADDPEWLVYALRKHHLGEERWTTLMHVGDVQVHPRFRLEVVRHFEAMAELKHLQVEQMRVRASRMTNIIDDALRSIILEVLGELQSLQRRLSAPSPPSSSMAHAPTSSRRWGDDVELRGLLPLRSKQRTEGAPSSSSSSSSFAQVDAARGTTNAAPPWRTSTGAGREMNFLLLTEACVLRVLYPELHADLNAAVRLHDAQWPYRPLVLSLLEVRQLRHLLRCGSPYQLLLSLSAALERRLPSSTFAGVGAPPSAPWTLSMHCAEVIALATHRMAAVRPRPPHLLHAATTTSVQPMHNVALSSDDDSDVVCCSDHDGAQTTTPTTTTTATLSSYLVPHAEEVDGELETTHRLMMSWCRDTLKRRAKRGRKKKKDDDDDDDDAQQQQRPVLLLLVHGASALVDHVERSIYTRSSYYNRRLNRFVCAYQERFSRTSAASGATPTTTTSAPATTTFATTTTSSSSVVDAPPPPQTQQLDEWLGSSAALISCTQYRFSGEVGDDDVEADQEDEDEDAEEEDVRGRTTATQMQLFDTRPSSEESNNTNANNNNNNYSLHQLLLAQPQLEEVSAMEALQTELNNNNNMIHQATCVELNVDEVAAGHVNDEAAVADVAATASSSRLALRVERLGHDHALLSANDGSTTTDVMAPLVLIIDRCATNLTDLLDVLRQPQNNNSNNNNNADDASTPRPRLGALPPNAEVRRIIITPQELSTLRWLEAVQEHLPLHRIHRLHVQLVSSSFAAEAFTVAVEAERAAFTSLAHTKAQLSTNMLANRESVRQTSAMLEQANFRARGSRSRAQRIAVLAGHWIDGRGPNDTTTTSSCDVPHIIFDERELRSSLPYLLYRGGVEMIPLTLTTADYVLSPEYAVERKSLSDFVQSLRSGRLFAQLAALSRRYRHPTCLVEWSGSQPLRLTFVPATSARTRTFHHHHNNNHHEEQQQAALYWKMGRLSAAYPHVVFLWSRSPAHAAHMLLRLKTSVARANLPPNQISLTTFALNPDDEDDGGEVGDGVRRPPPHQSLMPRSEVSHCASRVLSTFPGITPANAARVMRMCGTLAGLATIAEANMIDVMGEEHGRRLHKYLHTPFAEDVG